MFIMAKSSNPLATLSPETTTALVPSGGDYLRRVKLAAELTDEVKKKQAQVGEFIIQGDSVLGATFNAVVVKARPHALQLVQGSTKVGLESYDVNSAEFKQIRADRDADPKCQEPNNMYGNDYLLWLPDDKKFVTYFLCKMAFFKSDSSFAKAKGKGMVVIGTREEPSKTNPRASYRVPTVTPESDDYDAPTQEEFDHAIELFNNPRVQRAGEGADQTPANSGKGSKPKAGGRKGR